MDNEGALNIMVMYKRIRQTKLHKWDFGPYIQQRVRLGIEKHNSPSSVTIVSVTRAALHAFSKV